MNILVILPTNIGDAIMGFPVIDRMRAAHPDAGITVFTSPRTDDMVRRHSFVDNTVIFDKHWPVMKKAEFILAHMGRYDIAVDLKHSCIPILLGASRCTPVFHRPAHTGQQYLHYLKLTDKLTSIDTFARGEVVLADEEKRKWESIGVEKGSLFLFLAARGALKAFPKDRLARLLGELSRCYPLVLCGEEVDRGYYSGIDLPGVLDLCGRTAIEDIFYLLKNFARGVLSVDSGALHIASYCDVPIVGLYGPTSASVYGPWASSFRIVRAAGVSCAPCEKPWCVHNNECMDINAEDILAACRELFRG